MAMQVHANARTHDFAATMDVPPSFIIDDFFAFDDYWWNTLNANARRRIVNAFNIRGN